MVIFSVLSTIVGTIGAGISAAVGAIGSALSTFATGVGSLVGAIATALPQLGEALGKFGSALLQGLGILKPNEKVEDFGERALQMSEEGITMDKFENFDAYIDRMRNFDLDPEKAEKRSQAEKLAAGLGVGTVAMEKQFNATPGSLNAVWLLPLANPDYFTPERVQNLVSTGRVVGDIWAYLDKRLDASDNRRFEDGIVSGLSQGTTRETSKSEAYQALDTAREHWNSILQDLKNKGD